MSSTMQGIVDDQRLWSDIATPLGLQDAAGFNAFGSILDP
jgi:hypothetical protein